MTGISIQLHKLNVENGSLDGQFISKEHKQSVELCLSKIFFDHAIAPSSGKSPFSLKFDYTNRIVELNGQKIPIDKSRELKRIERIVRFYQHTGHFPRSGMGPSGEVVRAKITQQAIRSINEASVPGANGQILAGMRIAEDGISLSRNILFAIPGFGEGDPIANHLGYYAGIFWTFFSLRELSLGLEEQERSKEIKDSEGLRRSRASILSGTICSAASLSYLSGAICDTFVSGSVAAAQFTTANVLFGVGSMLAVGTSALGVLRCHRFNNRLNEYLENPKLTEIEKLQGALQFLKDSISVTPEEKNHLIDEIQKKHPDWDSDRKSALLQQKLIDLTETKVKYMKRRTSNKSLYLILTKADELLSKLGAPQTCAEGIKEAAEVIHTIQQENKTKMALYVLGFIAALISSLAMCLATFATGGVFPLALYGVSGAIYLALSVYTSAGIFFRKTLDHNGLQLPLSEEFPPYNPPVAV